MFGKFSGIVEICWQDLIFFSHFELGYDYVSVDLIEQDKKMSAVDKRERILILSM